MDASAKKAMTRTLDDIARIWGKGGELEGWKWTRVADGNGSFAWGASTLAPHFKHAFVPDTNDEYHDRALLTLKALEAKGK